MNSGLNLLGIARKAGKTAIGESHCAQAALDHKARLILLAADAGESTEKRVLRLEGKRLPVAKLAETKEELGAALGTAPCAAAAVLDLELAAALVKKLAQAQPERYQALSEAMEERKDKAVRRREDTRQYGKKSKRTGRENKA